jgi:hypothetical protein
MVRVVEDNQDEFYVFYVRFLEVFGTEILYQNYYGSGGPETALLAEGYSVSEPQVISLGSIFNPNQDTLAYVFYQTDQNASEDIYYLIFSEDGVSEPIPFLTSASDETHLRVSQDGSLVWAVDGTIKYCQLGRGPAGFYFTDPVSIDEGGCARPDINKHGSEFIVWEKGDPDAPEIWKSQWDYSNQVWGEPELILDDGRHINIEISRGMEDMGYMSSVILSDYLDEEGQYRISYYDMWGTWDYISEFSQGLPMQPELFTIDLITDFLGFGYLAFSNDEGLGKTDIYSSDWGDVTPWLSSYCRVDSTAFSEMRPVLFQGRWFFDGFDLVCFWQSYRNGHYQLWHSTTPVIIGEIPETKNNEIQVKVYPNPVHDRAQFEFLLPASGRVKLEIFNSVGQRVEILVDGTMDRGRHSVSWSPDNLPPGIYFYRLSASGRQMTSDGKLIIY